MPNVVIHMRRGRSPEDKRAIMGAVHAALVEAFKIPEGDRFLRVVEYEPEDFDLPPDRSDRFLHIDIKAFPGRSLDAKRALYAGIADRLEGLGIPRNATMIILDEPPRENWGIRGGRPASEVDLGYKLDV